MNEIIDAINEVRREVGSGSLPAGEGRTVLLRRSYDAQIEDVWDALTSPGRMSRWFLEVTGDLRPGGDFQLKGNAGGEILCSEPPRLLRVTWVFGDLPASEVQVRLVPDAEGRTEFELRHAVSVDDHWSQFGPGAVGVGWDLALLGLGLHLRGGSIEDPEAWQVSNEAREFVTRSSELWGAAHETFGVTRAEAAAAAANTTAAYVAEEG